MSMKVMGAGNAPGEKQRMFEIGPEEMWTAFLEEVNDLMIEEKQARHENDHVKVSEICLRVVSFSDNNFWLTNFDLFSCDWPSITTRSPASENSCSFSSRDVGRQRSLSLT